MAIELNDTSQLALVPPEKVKILVAMSGKIDSAVAAFLLKKRGYQVIGLAISLWENSTAETEWRDFAKTCSIENMNVVANLCAKIGMPFYAVNAQSEYYDRVMLPTISATLGGETPASCFHCQKFKMEILYEKMKYLKADFIATGHFLKIHHNHQSGEFNIYSANDEGSDQSSLMASLPQEILKKLILPLSELRISEVEKLAKNFNLPCVPKTKDQSLCYIRHQAYPAYIESRIHRDFYAGGNCLEIDSDKKYGPHDGIHHFQIGQEGINDPKKQVKRSNMKVVKIDSFNKVVYFGTEEHLLKKCAHLIDISMPKDFDISRPVKFFMKCAGLDKKILTNVTFKNNRSALLEFSEPVPNLNIGVQVTLYNKEGPAAKVMLSGTIFFSGDYFLQNRLGEKEKLDDGKIVFTEAVEFLF